MGRGHMPAVARAQIVSGLARALVSAWQRQQAQKHERPERLEHAAGRIVRGGGRELVDSIKP